MTVTLEKRGHVGYFTIKGSNELNPMTGADYRDLFYALQEFKSDRELWVGILTGHGDKAFSVGGDIKRMVDWADEYKAEDYRELLWNVWTEPPTPAVFREVTKMELWKPMIAAIRGYCLGAGLMLVCNLTDIRVATEDAKFGFAEIKLGLAGAGGTTRFPRQVPYAIVTEMPYPVALRYTELMATIARLTALG